MSRTIADVPSRSLLSRLTDHYLQIIANRAPIGFEAEFVNQRSENDLLSRHPDALLVRRRHDRFHLRRDQLEGRRRTATAEPVAGARTELVPTSRSIAASREPAAEEHRLWQDGPSTEEPVAVHAEADDAAPPAVPFDCDDDAGDEDAIAEIAMRSTTDAGLADRLWAARETAEAVKVGRRPDPRRALSRLVAGL